MYLFTTVFRETDSFSGKSNLCAKKRFTKRLYRRALTRGRLYFIAEHVSAGPKWHNSGGKLLCPGLQNCSPELTWFSKDNVTIPSKAKLLTAGAFSGEKSSRLKGVCISSSASSSFAESLPPRSRRTARTDRQDSNHRKQLRDSDLFSAKQSRTPHSRKTRRWTSNQLQNRILVLECELSQWGNVDFSRLARLRTPPSRQHPRSSFSRRRHQNMAGGQESPAMV